MEFWVPEEQILQVLEVCRQAPWHTFQFLTNNIRRVRGFVGVLPKNVSIGASTPPDFMWNKPMPYEKRKVWLDVTLNSLGQLRQMGITTWLSAEPLTIDVVGRMLNCAWDITIDWMVICAASNGNKYYAPNVNWVKDAVIYNEYHGIATFFKGNLKTLPWAVENWHEEFPAPRKEVDNAQ